MAVEYTNLQEIARKVLNGMGIYAYEDLQLTYVFKVGDEWRVNFSFKEKDSPFKEVGDFAVDAETGEITHAAKGLLWKK